MSTKEAAAEGQSVDVSPLGPLEGLGNQVKARPKYYAVLSVVIVALIVGGILFFRQRATAKSEAHTELMQRLEKAITETDPDQQIRALADLSADLKDRPEEGPYLLSFARALREAADSAEDPKTKLARYAHAIRVCDEFDAKHKNTVLGSLPWDLKPAAQGPSQTISGRIRSYCKAQVDWLTKHPMPTTGQPDCTLVIELEDAEGTAQTLKLSLYSSQAPASIAAIQKVVASGYYDGTTIDGLEIPAGEDSEVTAIHFGSAMAKIAPKAKESWYSDKDSVGFTVPPEPTTLKLEKGSVALEWLQPFFGSSPVQFVIFTTKDTFAGSRKIIGRVSEDSLEVLDALAAADTEEEGLKSKPTIHPLTEKSMWKIKKVSFEGTPTKKPEVLIEEELRLPEVPKKDG